MVRAVVVLALVMHVAHADDARGLVRDAAAAYADLRFVEALELLDRAWRLGDSDPAQLREIFSLAGKAAASTGDRKAAKLWFSRWLCLERGAELPVGTSPKLTAALADARTALDGAALAAHATRDAKHVVLTIDSDPLGMVAAARLGDVRHELAGTTAQFRAAGGEVELLDPHGNVLARIDAVREREIAGPIERSWYERWPAWAYGAGAFALAGGVAFYVAYDARQTIRDYDAHSSEHQYGEVIRYEDRLVAAQWTARVAFGAAAVSAIVSGVLWNRERGEHVSVRATGDGASLAWSIAW